MILSRMFLPSLTAISAALLSSANGEPGPSVEARTIHQFDKGTWVENIAVRDNGNLLVTLTDRPELYEIDPFQGTSPGLVYKFTGYKSVLGIAEAQSGVFAVAVGNFSIKTGSIDPESFAVFKVDYAGQRGYDHRTPKTSKITDIPEAGFLNGLTTLDFGKGTILVGDSVKGEVLRLDTRTGRYAVALKDDILKPPQNASLPIGLNGIRKYGNRVYFINTFGSLFGRVCVNAISGKAAGPYEIISDQIFADDFALDKAGIGYVASNQMNTILKVEADGSTVPFAGNLNSSLIPGPTSAAFGRTWKDLDILYVTTSGGVEAPVNGSFTEGGKIIAIKV